MIPDFAGVEIAEARLEYGLHLATAEPRWDFTLAETILVTTSGEDGLHTEIVDPDVPAQDLPEPLGDLVGERIVQVLVSREGALSVELADRHLSVAPSSSYEAWQVTGPGSERFICLPGGELTHFAPVRPADEDGDPDGDQDGDPPAPATS